MEHSPPGFVGEPVHERSFFRKSRASSPSILVAEIAIGTAPVFIILRISGYLLRFSGSCAANTSSRTEKCTSAARLSESAGLADVEFGILPFDRSDEPEATQ